MVSNKRAKIIVQEIVISIKYFTKKAKGFNKNG